MNICLKIAKCATEFAAFFAEPRICRFRVFEIAILTINVQYFRDIPGEAYYLNAHVEKNTPNHYNSNLIP